MSEIESNGPTASPPPGGNGASAPKLGRAAVVTAVVILVLLVIGFVPRWRERAALTREASELALPTVAVVSPAPAKAPPGLLLPAEVQPWIDTPVYARATGYVRRWLVDLGAHVKAGQLLAEIETPELDQELERTRHELAEAEASLGIAKITAARYTDLLKTASVNEQETAEKQADYALKAAVAEAARANLRRLEELRGFARVTAPFDGIVTARDVDVGDLITAGSAKQLFRLAQTDRLRVYARVPQTGAVAVAAGQQAELLLPERPNRVFPATVARTAGAISPDSRTLLVELEVDNGRGEILAGSFAQVRLMKAKGVPPLTLPGNALLFRAEGPQVGIVGPDDMVELRSVKLGRDFGTTVEILSGVGPNDRVVLNPSDGLNSGTRVRVAAAGGGAP
ncbi:MAG: efflux RND transporter periplasmic adaptor subunit [Acidobacteria bacterium]|nr:MAG: efflux RND transporter periplasmic adaptor subunit [Acidobacteriota bacterium]